MKILKRKGFYYLGHSFRKDEKVQYREKYLGKEMPDAIEQIKESFLRECMEESVFMKLRLIRINFGRHWKSLPESVKRKLLIEFSVDFTYNTNAIEGSTVSLTETDELIRRKIAPNRPLADVQETLNHSKVFFDVLNFKGELTTKAILEWHREIFGETKPDIAGKFRDYLIRVGSYVAPDWQDVKKLVGGLIKWNRNQVLNPVEHAARLHYRFEKIHPFGDGNGRIGRLLIIHALKKGRYPLVNIEYKKRKSYYKALTRDENYFLKYFIRTYISFNKQYGTETKRNECRT